MAIFNEVKKKLKCKDCEYLIFSEVNGGPNRYYCEHPVACEEKLCGAVKLCLCDRGRSELKVKTAPRWCPVNRGVTDA